MTKTLLNVFVLGSIILTAPAAFAMGKHAPQPNPIASPSPTPSVSPSPAPPCAEPNVDASTLFKMIADPKTSSGDVTNFLQTHLIASDAYNSQCETVFLSSLENKRLDLFQTLYDHFLPDPSAVQAGVSDEKNQRSIYSFVLKSGDLNGLKTLRQEALSHQQPLSLVPIYGDSETELMVATQGTPSTDMIRYLLSSGVDVNAKDGHDSTALLYATMNQNDIEVIRLLLQAGADVNYSSREYFTALDYVLETPKVGLDEVLLLLQYKADVKAVAGDGTTSLMFAANDSLEVVQTLLDAGADARAVDSYGYTALLFAAANGSLDVVNVLIKAGVDVNAATTLSRGSDSSRGLTPLIFAVVNNSNEVVRALIQAGASVNASDAQGLTVLMYAAYPRKGGTYQEQVQEAILSTLLQTGADPSKRASDGSTALSIATSNYAPEQILKILGGSR
jgi:ankyrin repeat protein